MDRKKKRVFRFRCLIVINITSTILVNGVALLLFHHHNERHPTKIKMASHPAAAHVSESIADRRKNRELAEARQSGNAAPEVDVKTGAIINPHNPEFITRRPWYLGGNDDGPSLDHQADQRTLGERLGVTLATSDYLVQQQRQKTKELYQQGFQALQTGMWLEGLKKNRKPYLMCKIVSIDSKRQRMDVEYEDGTVERSIRWPSKEDRTPRLRLTKLGSRIIPSSTEDAAASGAIIIG